MKNNKETRFADLTNEELVLVYYRIDNYFNTLNKNLEKNVISKQVETPMGITTSIKEIPKEHVEQFKKSHYYKTLNNVMKKLKPVIAIIEECDDTVIKKLEQLK
jgi:hypothetical protein